MLFSVDAEILASYVNLVSRVVSAKSSLPILNNILLEAEKDKLRITGTDLEIQMTATVQLSAQKEGKISLNAKLFSQYINTIPKEEKIKLELVKGVLQVSSEKHTAEFATKEPDDFPLFEQSETETLFELPAETFSNMVEKTIFACAKDDIRPILTGIDIEVEGSMVTMVALDTFRLSRVIATIPQQVISKKELVISAAAMDNMNRIIKDALISSTTETAVVTCKIAKAGNFIVMQYGDALLYTRLIEGEYPEYKQVIPAAHQTEAKVKRNEWLDALKRVGVFAQSAVGQKVVMEFVDGKLLMESQVPEIGKVHEELTATLEGEPIRIAFQIKFLTEILALLSDEDVVFRAINKTSPGIFLQASEESFLHLLMPLKLDD